MNISKLSQIIFVGICAGFFICGNANGQITGTGTTGSTAGSGRGEGSAGVMTGTGPDPLNASTPYEETITERMIVMPNSQRKKGAKVRKRSKKIGQNLDNAERARGGSHCRSIAKVSSPRNHVEVVQFRKVHTLLNAASIRCRHGLTMVGPTTLRISNSLVKCAPNAWRSSLSMLS
jgi:hypothetical protein